uniref:U1-poneritoxin-Ae1g n=1 Tax=Anochetus emarginatus TaxID=486636 RepID=PON1G_ANOEM|nr:RecName: Full=U1-poneritoxin-Ae1g; Short=U1-PONTX-Ae1g; AltName: Full=Poneratoxin [Anochetus emarginatus]
GTGCSSGCHRVGQQCRCG